MGSDMTVVGRWEFRRGLDGGAEICGEVAAHPPTGPALG